MNAKNHSSILNCNDVQRRFDRAAAGFDSVDFVHSVTREGLFARLEPMSIEAKTVVDLGSATGSAANLLARRFRRAQIIAADLSILMLERVREKRGWLSRTTAVQATAEALPFADQSVDVVFSNLLLPWVSDPAPVFAEVSRVLRGDGLFLFATLGPDSLNEIRRAWAAVDPGEHVNRFLDMHDIGDTAVAAGLRDPVLDVDHLTVSYKNADSLFQDLSAMGARNSLQNRANTLGGAGRFRAMVAELDRQRRDSLLTLDLELVYGHCWGSGRKAGNNEYRVDAGRIGRRNA